METGFRCGIILARGLKSARVVFTASKISRRSQPREPSTIQRDLRGTDKEHQKRTVTVHPDFENFETCNVLPFGHPQLCIGSERETVREREKKGKGLVNRKNLWDMST